MKRSPERRGFFAPREGKFQVHNPGEWQTIIEPSNFASPPLPATQRDETEPAPDVNLTLPSPDQASFEQTSTTRAAQPHVFQPLHFRRQRFENRYRYFFRMALLSLACLAFGGIGGYLFPKPARKTVTLPGLSNSQGEIIFLTPTDQDELNAAYAARRATRYTDAEQLFTALGRKHPNWGAMEIEVARTLLYQRNLSDARGVLKVAADKGSMPADANFNLGVLYMVEKAYNEAESSFATAVALDPSRPDFYYFWGECLRVEGKPLEAATKFRAALARNQYETEGGLYLLDLWLSEIEADRENSDGTNAQIDAALAQPRPPMEALFAAAARNFKAGDISAGAAQIMRARQLVEPAMFPIIMKDPIFAQERLRPEMAEIFRALAQDVNPKTDEPASLQATPASGDGHGLTPTPQISTSPAKSQ